MQQSLISNTTVPLFDPNVYGGGSAGGSGNKEFSDLDCKNQFAVVVSSGGEGDINVRKYDRKFYTP